MEQRLPIVVFQRKQIRDGYVQYPLDVEFDQARRRRKYSELNDDAQNFFDCFCVDLYIRKAAKHIVALPITVKTAWRATTTSRDSEL